MVYSQNEMGNSPVKLLFGGALELGGDEVAKVFFTNGTDQSIRAGQGGSLAVGGEYRFPKLDVMSLRATFGIKYVTTEADNAHIRLTRIPLIFSANYFIQDKVRFSCGFVSHQNIKLKTDGVGQNIDFTGKPGVVFEIAYKYIGLSYTAMQYQGPANELYNASAIGLTVSGVWSGKK